MSNRRTLVVLMVLVVSLIGGLTLLVDAASVADAITPLDFYSSDRSKAMASKFRSRHEKMLAEIAGVFKPNEFRYLTADESTVAGSGFWKNPTKSGSDDRYWGMLTMVVTPAQFIFGDNRDGRVASVFDRYGKTMLDTLNKEIQNTNDAGLAGIAIGIIWASDIRSPKNGEGMIVFINKADCIQYLNYKLTLQALFNKSDLFLFAGPEELDTLTQFLLES